MMQWKRLHGMGMGMVEGGEPRDCELHLILRWSIRAIKSTITLVSLHVIESPD
jgi:hypothetical protein